MSLWSRKLETLWKFFTKCFFNEYFNENKFAVYMIYMISSECVLRTMNFYNLLDTERGRPYC